MESNFYDSYLWLLLMDSVLLKSNEAKVTTSNTIKKIITIVNTNYMTCYNNNNKTSLDSNLAGPITTIMFGNIRDIIPKTPTYRATDRTYQIHST